MKVKRANRLMPIIDEICVMHLQKVDTLLMIGIQDKYFHFIHVIMVLYIYKYWLKMLKRLKFPPLIKARASSTYCTMGNLTCSRHTTYLHTIYVKSREIHILSTIQILGHKILIFALSFPLIPFVTLRKSPYQITEIYNIDLCKFTCIYKLYTTAGQPRKSIY